MKKKKKENECSEEITNTIDEANSIMKEKLDECNKEKESSLISMVFELFASLYFDEKESKKYWQDVIGHRDKLRKKLKRDVGIRVAILDYFSNIDNRLKNPKIVEMELFEEILKASKEDPKTGLFNGKYFLEVLKNEINKAKRNDFPVSLLFLDIDDFKSYNDKYGHIVGDQILFHISNIIHDLFRGEDIAARFGGDEFVVMLPYTEKNEAVVVANRIADRVKNEPAGIDNIPQERYAGTISIGIASYPEDSDNANDLIKRADIALYGAKETGKNRIVAYKKDKDKNVKVPLNRRQIDRYECRGQEIYFKIKNSVDNYHAYLRNISAKGLLMEIPFVIPLLHGVPLEVKMNNKKFSNIKFKGEILHARPKKTGCLVALKFDKSKTDEKEIKAFIESFQK